MNLNLRLHADLGTIRDNHNLSSLSKAVDHLMALYDPDKTNPHKLKSFPSVPKASYPVDPSSPSEHPQPHMLYISKPLHFALTTHHEAPETVIIRLLSANLKHMITRVTPTPPTPEGAQKARHTVSIKETTYEKLKSLSESIGCAVTSTLTKMIREYHAAPTDYFQQCADYRTISKQGSKEEPIFLSNQTKQALFVVKEIYQLPSVTNVITTLLELGESPSTLGDDDMQHTDLLHVDK